MRLRRADSSRLPRHTRGRQGDRAVLAPQSDQSRANPADVYRYKVEPYVVSTDIYAVAPHVGRGGWTWYTGSAGWMQRAGIEGIQGLRIRGTSLHLDPCIPKAWPGFGVVFRYRSARYEIQVENPQGVSGRIQLATLDGETLAGNKTGIPLTDDGATHQIRIVLG
jgi:cyclic beta-1,2-glucan synthetase